MPCTRISLLISHYAVNIGSSFLLHFPVVFYRRQKASTQEFHCPHYCILIKMELTGQQFICAQTRAESRKLAFRNPRINCYSLGALPRRAEVRSFIWEKGKVEELQRYGIQQSSRLHCIELINRLKYIHSSNGIFCVCNYF